MNPQASLTRALATEEGVYGLILVSGLIAASGSAGAPAWKSLLFTGVTVVVFWLAHVYAGAVATHGTATPAGGPATVRESISEAMHKSHGLIVSTLPPAAALLLGALGVIGDVAATWAALWVCVSVLALLGYRAYARKGAVLWVRLAGAVATASFGMVIIAAKAIVTH
ncbi:hypothetical protein [Leucobacter luti]|uniref:Uncharacterized protein n=1 Tax=Leucobacter luti TaxID=340320 RepID=A0A4Q7U728_9MICO|nr:hypothetical protein [Leucobacter luti]RZT68398.1 hypothetical protein EV139_0121 [Leucobacter luti]